MREIFAAGRGRLTMSYAVIKTGGKQFAVEEGQTLRVPTIAGDAGSKVDVQALVLGGGKTRSWAVTPRSRRRSLDTVKPTR